MDLKQLREQVVLQEARALDLGMAAPSPDLLEELRYSLHDVNRLRDQLPEDNGTRALRARIDVVYAEIQSLMAQWAGAKCTCRAA